MKLTAFSGLFFGAGVWGLWGLAKPLGWIMSRSYQPRSCLDVSWHLARGTWRFCGISMRRKCKRCCEYLWIIAWVSFKLTFIWCSQSLTVYRTPILECLPHSWNSWFVGSWSKVVPGAGRAERSDSGTGALVCINSLALLKDTPSWLEPERHRTRYYILVYLVVNLLGKLANCNFVGSMMISCILYMNVYEELRWLLGLKHSFNTALLFFTFIPRNILCTSI